MPWMTFFQACPVRKPIEPGVLSAAIFNVFSPKSALMTETTTIIFEYCILSLLLRHGTIYRTINTVGMYSLLELTGI